jgi:hypothetical protein
VSNAGDLVGVDEDVVGQVGVVGLDAVVQHRDHDRIPAGGRGPGLGGIDVRILAGAGLAGVVEVPLVRIEGVIGRDPEVVIEARRRPVHAAIGVELPRPRQRGGPAALGQGGDVLVRGPEEPMVVGEPRAEEGARVGPRLEGDDHLVGDDLALPGFGVDEDRGRPGDSGCAGNAGQ